MEPVEYYRYNNKDYVLVENAIKGNRSSIAQVGDIFIPNQDFDSKIRKGIVYTLYACDCFDSACSDMWPNGNQCGPHLYEDGKYTHRILGRIFEDGYCHTGKLYRLNGY